MFSMNRRDIPTHLLEYFKPRKVYKPKDDFMIPHRVYDALMTDGWYGRMDICWHKRAPMPESVTDRPTKAHEQVFLLTKSPRYWYDSEAIAEQTTDPEYRERGKIRPRPETAAQIGKGFEIRGGLHSQVGGRSTRNRRSVWTLGPESFKGAHFAVMPTKLVEPCILAGCPHRVCAECGAPWVRVVEREIVWPKKRTGSGLNSDRNDGGLACNAERTSTTTGFAPTCDCNGDTRPGVVLDPFGGSGTVGVVARRLGRDAVLFELNPDYLKLAEQRIGSAQPPLFPNGAHA